MAGRLVTMSAKELDRLEVIRRVSESRLSQVKASELLDLTSRQVRRLCRAGDAKPVAGLAFPEGPRSGLLLPRPWARTSAGGWLLKAS